jgi:CheY-like chemotaxis protein/anti-sigma regulatory factor (Ser/Thr protein kinase)
MKILFVDDEENIRELFLEYFKNEYEVTLAADGMEALDIALSQQFDLIISDISLPKLNGVQFIKKLRFEGNITPFIVITGDSDIQLAIDVFRIGAVDFFLKPFRMDSLRRRIEKYADTDVDLKVLFRNQEISFHDSELNIEIFPRIKNINKYVAIIIEHIQLNPIVNEEDLLSIKVVLYELLANAIEHGSAGITYREKQSILESTDQYFEKVDELCQKYNRRIYVLLKISDEGIVIKVQDQGSGFNLKEIPSPLDDHTGNLLNGRGIFLVRMNIDSISYNEKGNEVTVTKSWTSKN